VGEKDLEERAAQVKVSKNAIIRSGESGSGERNAERVKKQGGKNEWDQNECTKSGRKTS